MIEPDIRDEQLMRRFLVGDVTPDERDAVEETFAVDEAYFLELAALEEEMLAEHLRGDMPEPWATRFAATLPAYPARQQRLEEMALLRSVLLETPEAGAVAGAVDETAVASGASGYTAGEMAAAKTAESANNVNSAGNAGHIVGKTAGQIAGTTLEKTPETARDAIAPPIVFEANRRRRGGPWTSAPWVGALAAGIVLAAVGLGWWTSARHVTGVPVPPAGVPPRTQTTWTLATGQTRSVGEPEKQNIFHVPRGTDDVALDVTIAVPAGSSSGAGALARTLSASLGRVGGAPVPIEGRPIETRAGEGAIAARWRVSASTFTVGDYLLTITGEPTPGNRERLAGAFISIVD